MAVSNLRILNG